MAMDKTNSKSEKAAFPKYAQMEKDRKYLVDLITQVEEEMNLNPVDVMQADSVERMNKLKDGLDRKYKTCAQKFRGWKADYATVLDTNVEASLKSKLTNLIQDLVAYKRLALVKQDTSVDD